ncbi:sensor histidine kinase [bacterium SCSIO 12643]|nr:sensor histidine kinase [bacterium SCSIO 12643]
MNFKQVIHPFKNIWQVIGVMVLINLVFFMFFWPAVYDSWSNFIMGMIWGSTIWLTQSVGNSAVFRFLDEKLPWRDGMLRRALATVVSVGTYSAFAYLAVQFIMFFIFVDNATVEMVWTNSIRSLSLTLAISYGISFILTFVGFGKALIRSEVEKEKLNSEMMTYKYESLRNQINPHFLFNSFNVLSELVYEDQDLAVKFIRQLSDLYRYVLDAKEKEVISLSEELKFIESFTFLLKTRFESRVNFDFEIQVQEEEYIVPMSLQLLIENCIKHNEATSKSPLNINITRQGKYIEVKNNLQRKSVPDVSFKIGLNNLKERYSYFNDQEVLVNETDDAFIVSIPIIQISEN